MPNCEICGKKTHDLFLVSIEGAKMNVCRDCSSHGVFIKKVREPPVKKERIIKEEPETLIIDNYSELIRKGREKLGLDQKEFGIKVNESVSIIKKIESGKFVPTEKMAKKFEKLFSIKLYQPIKPQELEIKGKGKKQRKALTLGDIVKVKK